MECGEGIPIDVKGIAQFLPWDVSKVLMSYLAIVVPFHESIDPIHRIPRACVYLWQSVAAAHTQKIKNGPVRRQQVE
jgi:hypothetical protein